VKYRWARLFCFLHHYVCPLWFSSPSNLFKRVRSMFPCYTFGKLLQDLMNLFS